MSKSAQDDNLAEEEDFLENGGEWIEEASDTSGKQETSAPIPRGGPKWKAIEDYWERKRLRDELQDYLSDDE